MAEAKEPTIFLNAKEILKTLGVSHGQVVMDLGCGSGYFVIEASRLVGDSGKVYAVDVQKPALSTVASKAATYGLTNIKTVWSDAEVYGAARKIKNASIDVMLLIQLFSQTHKHQEVFREAVRMTKPEGQIVVVDWRPDRLTYGPPKSKRLSIEQIKALATHEGWSRAKEIAIGAYHFGLVFTKS
ncbi:MAG: methyltransferase domain-containing protein [Patescibacteria group bacterium]